MEDIAKLIRDAIAAETRASKHRDRCSGVRVHPIRHDIDVLHNFVSARRVRQPGVLQALRRSAKAVDTEALRFLVDVARNEGASNGRIRRCCDRILDYCQTIEDALVLGRALKETP